MIQLMILLRNIGKEYFAGEATDEDIQGVLAKICKIVTAHMASCQKGYSPEQCQKELFNAILMSPPDNSFNDLRKGLYKKRRNNTSNGSPILN